MCEALKAGCIWDEELKKWMNPEDLLNHPNPEVKAIWEKSSQKEYGNLFQGAENTVGMCNTPDVGLGKETKSFPGCTVYPGGAETRIPGD